MKKKLKAALSRLPRLPRKWRLVRNVICILLAVYFIWLFLGCRSITPMGAFRRTEREQMAGSAEIVCRLKSEETTRIVGKVSDGYLIFGTQWAAGWYPVEFAYWEKKTGVTLAATGTPSPVSDKDSLELLLFHELNGVVKAEVLVTISRSMRFQGHTDWPSHDVETEETYTIEFTPCGDQVLSGRIVAKTPNLSDESRAERRAIEAWIFDGEEQPVEVRLYDGEGKIVFSYEGKYPFLEDADGGSTHEN